jgi:hypothetical protein
VTDTRPIWSDTRHGKGKRGHPIRQWKQTVLQQRAKIRKGLPKTARGQRIIRFRQCRRNCRCGRDPEGGPYFLKRWREGGRRGEACVPWQEVITTFNPLGPLGREQREEPKSDDALPKRAIGSVHLEFKRCGRPNCRCRFGLFHGPYVYRHWREGGRQRKEYVQMDRLSDVLLDMERQRADAARPAEVRRALKEVRHA